MGQGETSGADVKSEESEASSAEKRLEEKLQSVRAKEPEGTRIVEDSPAVGAGAEETRQPDVSAATVARMMGLATGSELSLLEGKIDLLSTRVNTLTVRMEKVLNVMSKAPTAQDIDRVDINIGSLKTMIRETLESLSLKSAIDEEEGGDLSGAKIMTNDAQQNKAQDTADVDGLADELAAELND